MAIPIGRNVYRLVRDVDSVCVCVYVFASLPVFLVYLSVCMLFLLMRLGVYPLTTSHSIRYRPSGIHTVSCTTAKLARGSSHLYGPGCL